MNIDLIPIGDDPPNNVNVIIEVPVGGYKGDPIPKHEISKAPARGKLRARRK